MPYKVTIKSEQGNMIPGVLYFWLDGEQIGEANIPTGQATLTDDEVESADHYTVESPGYHFYGTSVIYDDTVFTLAKKPNTALYVGLALVGGFFLSKLIKFRL